MKNYFIPNKKPDEHVILQVRRHPFILLSHMALWVLVMFLPAAFFLVFQDWLPYILEHAAWYPILVVFLGTLYLIAWILIFNRFVDYYLDIWVVTNFRIINIEQMQIFSRVIAEHDLDKIQDVAAETNGMLPTFLNYGDVHIQTAGEKQRFVFGQVPDPVGIKRRITALCEAAQQHATHNNIGQ